MNAFQDLKIVEVSCFHHLHPLDRFYNQPSLHVCSLVCVSGEQLLGSSEELSGHDAETNHLQQQERDRREGERMPEQETPPDQRYSVCCTWASFKVKPKVSLFLTTSAVLGCYMCCNCGSLLSVQSVKLWYGTWRRRTSTRDTSYWSSSWRTSTSSRGTSFSKNMRR